MRYIDLDRKKNKRKLKKKTIMPVLKIGAGSVLLLALFFFLFSKGVFGFSSLLKPVSVFSQIVNPQQISSTDGRTNILLLAVDSREKYDSRCEDVPGGAGLTDTIILASVDVKDKNGNVVLVSLPRDVWVETGYFSGKINSAYSFAGGGKSGAELLSRVVGGVCGVPVHYYAVVDFSGFVRAVNILGGIEVDVEQSFDDYKYPIPGEECAPNEADRWEHIHFDAGVQKMDGERALKFVRSRHAQGAEGSDFARSHRQQKVLLAVKRKFFSLSTFSSWNKVRQLYDTFKDSVQTDLGLWEMERLYNWGWDRENLNIKMEVLDGGNGLFKHPENADSYGGHWVLVPRAGDFSEVRDYVRGILFPTAE